MTKLTILAILSLIYIGVIRLAYFLLSVFIVLFFGMSLWELIRTADNRQGITSPRS